MIKQKKRLGQVFLKNYVVILDILRFANIKEKDNKILQFRLLLILQVKRILEHGMGILGIEMPERM